MTIAADFRGTMMEIDLHSDEEWKRIEDVITRIISDVGK